MKSHWVVLVVYVSALALLASIASGKPKHEPKHAGPGRGRNDETPKSLKAAEVLSILQLECGLSGYTCSFGVGKITTRIGTVRVHCSSTGLLLTLKDKTGRRPSVVGHIPRGDEVAKLLMEIEMIGKGVMVPGCVRRLAGADKGKGSGAIRQLQPSPMTSDDPIRRRCNQLRRVNETRISSDKKTAITTTVPVPKSRGVMLSSSCACLGIYNSAKRCVSAFGLPCLAKDCADIAPPGLTPEEAIAVGETNFTCNNLQENKATLESNTFCGEHRCVDVRSVNYDDVSLAITAPIGTPGARYINAKCKAPPSLENGIVPADEYGLSIFEVTGCKSEIPFVQTCDCSVVPNPRSKRCTRDGRSPGFVDLQALAYLEGFLSGEEACLYYAEPIVESGCFGESTDLRKLMHDGSGFWRIHGAVARFAWVRCLDGLCLTAHHAVRTKEKGWTTWGEHIHGKQYVSKFERIYNLVGVGAQLQAHGVHGVTFGFSEKPK